MSQGKSSLVTEERLGRVLKHFKENGFAIISSWQGEVDVETNKKRFKKLKSAVRSAGFGFLPLIGTWYREGAPAPEEEPSLIIASKEGEDASQALHRLVVSLGEKYSQDAVVWSPGGRVEVISTHSRTGTPPGKPLMVFETFTPSAVGAAFVKLRRGYKMTVENFEWRHQAPPQGFMEALIRGKEGEIAFTK